MDDYFLRCSNLPFSYSNWTKYNPAAQRISVESWKMFFPSLELTFLLPYSLSIQAHNPYHIAFIAMTIRFEIQCAAF
jgi:hypothetical protein